MRILAVAHESGMNGGANRSLFTVINLLRQHYSVDVDVVVPKENGEFVEALRKAGINVYFQPYKCDFSVYRYSPKDLLKWIYVRYINLHNMLLAKRTKSMFSNCIYDIIYVNTRMSSYGAFLAKELNIPLVCHIREIGDPHAIWGCWTLRMIGRYSKKVIAISTVMKEIIQEKIPESKVIAILNGIDCNHVESITDNFTQNNINILLTGRVVAAKGHMDALKAVFELKQRGYNNLMLHIAGSISDSTNGIKYYESLKTYAMEHNIDDNVKFLGEVNNIFELRKNMAIELMCAICEPFGRVTVEAMRSGLLVIGSNTGGTLDIIKDGESGLLYSQGDYISLADKIEWAIINEEDRKKIQEYGRRYSIDHFTKEENVEKIYATLKSVI